MNNTSFKNHECKESCAKVETLVEATNYPTFPGYAKLPIVLGEFTVQIDTEAEITLDKPAFEIKRIKKNLFLTQCRFIPGTSKLFLAGYIRKNIEYATADDIDGKCINGAIYHTTAKIPFKVVTKVDFERYPIIYSNSQMYEIEYLNDNKCGLDANETDRAFIENFNEKVFCELEFAEIFEADINDDVRFCDEMDAEEKLFEHEAKVPTFDKITEKMVIYLHMKLLQKQQVYYDRAKTCDTSIPANPRNSCLVPKKY